MTALSWDEWLSRQEARRETKLGPADPRGERALRLPQPRPRAARPMSERFVVGGFREDELFPRVRSDQLRVRRALRGAGDAAELAARVRLLLEALGQADGDGRG